MKKPKTALSVLVAARKLITPRKRWTKGSWARADGGITTDETDPAATCFCMSGAIRRYTNGDAADAHDIRVRDAARSAVHAVIHSDSIAAYNDAVRRTHKQVLAAFDRAIANLRKEKRRAA